VGDLSARRDPGGNRRPQPLAPTEGRVVWGVAKALRRRTASLAVLDRWLRWVKYGVLVWILLGTAAYGVMVFRQVDPWRRC